MLHTSLPICSHYNEVVLIEWSYHLVEIFKKIYKTGPKISDHYNEMVL